MREVGGVDLSAGWDRRVSVFGSMIGMEASVCGNRQKWKQKKARDSRDGFLSADCLVMSGGEPRRTRRRGGGHMMDVVEGGVCRIWASRLG
jgi:hypothetical protein